MLRFLRAWAWVRWRVRINAIERSDRADRIQRFTRATEVLGPVLVAVMMVPTALFALALGGAAGFGMASGAGWGDAAMHVTRIVLFAATVLTIVGPVMLPSGRGIASLPRLLLLPVSRGALYASELVGGIAEPWVLMTALGAAALTLGALAAGGVATALVALVAGMLLLLTLAGLGACLGAVLHVLMGNRRRGEWIAVAALTSFSLLGMLPALMNTGGTRDERRTRDSEVESRIAEALEEPAGGLLALLPSELYVASVARTAGAATGSPILPLAGLATAAAAALGAGWLVWRRAIDLGGLSAGRSRARDKQGTGAAWMRAPMSGVAFTFIQHVLRTARGRAIVLPSIVMSLVFAGLVAFRGGVDLGMFSIGSGFAVAVFGTVMAFLSPVQLWMNQFAIDRAGLTMLCLQPLSNAEILRGKMAGAAALVGGIALLPFGLGLVIGARVPAAYWTVLVLSALAAFAVIAPVAALLSTYFPKHVDLTSIGQRSNAHPAAGFLGGILTAAAAAPGVGAGILGFRVMDSAVAAIGLAAAWLVVAVVLHWMLWKLAVAAFENRRDALVAAANGR
ncbi:MAG: hypothetical protein M3Q55_07790 [Acidobacteriota bacterium]|nr:hypothetical protein [Acidobacteriota bacterium]